MSAPVARLPPLEDIAGVAEFGLTTRFNNLRGRVLYFRPTVLRRSNDGRYHNRVLFIGFDGVLYLCHSDGTAKRALDLSTVTAIVEDKGFDVALICDFPLVLRFHKPEVKRAEDKEFPLAGLRQFMTVVKTFAPNASLTKGLHEGIGSLQLFLDKPPGFKPPGRLPILSSQSADPDAEALAMGLSAAQYARLRAKRHPSAPLQVAEAAAQPQTVMPTQHHDNDDDDEQMPHDNHNTRNIAGHKRGGLRFADEVGQAPTPSDAQGKGQSLPLRVDPNATLPTSAATFHQIIDGTAESAVEGATESDTAAGNLVDEPWQVDAPSAIPPPGQHFDVPVIESGSDHTSSLSTASAVSRTGRNQVDDARLSMSSSFSDEKTAPQAARPPAFALGDAAMSEATARCLLGDDVADGVEIEIIRASHKYAELMEDMEDGLWAADHPEEVELEEKRHAEAVQMHDRIRRMYRHFLPGKLPIAEKVIGHCVEKAEDDPSAPREEIVVLEALIDRFGPEPPPTPPEASRQATPLPPLDPLVNLRLRRRIFRMYAAYLPHKLPLLPTMLRTYGGSEVDWIDALLEKCGRPEPSDDHGVQECRMETIRRIADHGVDGGNPSPDLADAAYAVSQLYMDVIENEASFRLRIERMYQLYLPEKVGTVSALLRKNRVVFPDPDGPPRLLVETTDEPATELKAVSVGIQWEPDPQLEDISPPADLPDPATKTLVIADDTFENRNAAKAVCQAILDRLISAYGDEDLPEEIQMAVEDVAEYERIQCERAVEEIYRAYCPENLARLPALFEKYREKPATLVAAISDKYTPGSTWSPMPLSPYEDDFSELQTTHSARYRARNLPKPARAEPEPKKMKKLRTRPPRRNAVANSFLSQIASESEAVAHSVIADVNATLQPKLQNLELEVRNRRNANRLHLEAQQERQRLDLAAFTGVGARGLLGDEFVREVNLALLVSEACCRSSALCGMKPTVASDQRAVQALAAAFHTHATKASGSHAVTAREVSVALQAIAR